MDEWLGRIKRSFFHAYRIVMHGRIHQVAGPDLFILQTFYRLSQLFKFQSLTRLFRACFHIRIC